MYILLKLLITTNQLYLTVFLANLCLTCLTLRSNLHWYHYIECLFVAILASRVWHLIVIQQTFVTLPDDKHKLENLRSVKIIYFYSFLWLLCNFENFPWHLSLIFESNVYLLQLLITTNQLYLTVFLANLCLTCLILRSNLHWYHYRECLFVAILVSWVWHLRVIQQTFSTLPDDKHKVEYLRSVKIIYFHSFLWHLCNFKNFPW
jgi:hypothetical protein